MRHKLKDDAVDGAVTRIASFLTNAWIRRKGMDNSRKIRRQTGRRQQKAQSFRLGESMDVPARAGTRSSGQLDAGESARKRKASQPSRACALCGKPIFDLAGPWPTKNSDPVHSIAPSKGPRRRKPSKREKKSCTGAGCFGVVASKRAMTADSSSKEESIGKKEGEKQLWRKDLSSYITRI